MTKTDRLYLSEAIRAQWVDSLHRRGTAEGLRPAVACLPADKQATLAPLERYLRPYVETLYVLADESGAFEDVLRASRDLHPDHAACCDGIAETLRDCPRVGFFGAACPPSLLDDVGRLLASRMTQPFRIALEPSAGASLAVFVAGEEPDAGLAEAVEAAGRLASLCVTLGPAAYLPEGAKIGWEHRLWGWEATEEAEKGQHQLALRLETLAEEIALSLGAYPLGTEGRTVLVGHAAPDQFYDLIRLRQNLLRRGYRLLPERPRDLNDLKGFIEDAQRADLFAQVLGKDPLPDGMITRQAWVARDKILMRSVGAHHPDGDVADKHHLIDLRNDDIHVGDVAEFCAAIDKRLKDLQRPSRTVVAVMAAGDLKGLKRVEDARPGHRVDVVDAKPGSREELAALEKKVEGSLEIHYLEGADPGVVKKVRQIRSEMVRDKPVELFDPSVERALLGAPREGVPASALPKLKAFIIHANEDEEHLIRVKRQLRELEANGLIEPWDDSRIAGGDDYKARIFDAIEDCDLALVLLSVGLLVSDFARDEIDLARRKNKRLVPIYLLPMTDPVASLGTLGIDPLGVILKHDEESRTFFPVFDNSDKQPGNLVQCAREVKDVAETLRQEKARGGEA